MKVPDATWLASALARAQKMRDTLQSIEADQQAARKFLNDSADRLARLYREHDRLMEMLEAKE